MSVTKRRPTRVHLQRKLIPSMDGQEVDGLDLSPFAAAADIHVGIVPNDDGLWLTIIQETDVPLDEVPILPGFHRYVPEVPGQSRSLH